MQQLEPEVSPLAPRSSPLTAFAVLTVHSFRRHWRVKQMGWVAVGLLALVVTWVALVSMRGAWGLDNRRAGRGLPTYPVYGDRLLPRQIGADAMVSPVTYGIPSLITAAPQRLLATPGASPNAPRFTFRADWTFVNFSRWVMLVGFVGFVLPLFTMSYATAAFGTERESRSLVWLMTRPIPRSAIYLAKFLGTLPWCVVFGLGGFAAMCLAGGELGARAFALYWPAAVAGTVAFAALFHLIGAVFRRPVVVGLVYVFFYEALVAALPGSLKLLSLSYYVRSLMYNGATAAGYPTGMLDMMTSVPDRNAWVFLAIVTAGLTGLGMWLFTRSEYRDDI
jgi:ABC-type transport system involved in multi-copper enzyme maturation permease subunit